LEGSSETDDEEKGPKVKKSKVLWTLHYYTFSSWKLSIMDCNCYGGRSIQ
jgi:hypothetical protein